MDSPFDRTAALLEVKTIELENCWKVRDLPRMFALIDEIGQLTEQLKIDDTGDDDG
jgi:UDP-N-acetylglucosamine enolpyruvyl transferase